MKDKEVWAYGSVAPEVGSTEMLPCFEIKRCGLLKRLLTGRNAQTHFLGRALYEVTSVDPETRTFVFERRGELQE